MLLLLAFVEESNDKIQIFQKLDWESNESSLVCAALRQRGNHPTTKNEHNDNDRGNNSFTLTDEVLL